MNTSTKTKPSDDIFARRSYRAGDGISYCKDLPFVYISPRSYKESSHWRVPPADDYAKACEMGRAYAAHFVQFMKDNPFWVSSNHLGHIAADIDFKDESEAKGYWVGFFSHLERLIYAGARNIDVFDDLRMENGKVAEIEARRDLEG